MLFIFLFLYFKNLLNCVFARLITAPQGGKQTAGEDHLHAFRKPEARLFERTSPGSSRRRIRSPTLKRRKKKSLDERCPLISDIMAFSRGFTSSLLRALPPAPVAEPPRLKRSFSKSLKWNRLMWCSVCVNESANGVFWRRLISFQHQPVV